MSPLFPKEKSDRGRFFVSFISKRKNGSRHPMPAPGGFCCLCGKPAKSLSACHTIGSVSCYLCGKPTKSLSACHMITPVAPSSPITPVITVTPVSSITGRNYWQSSLAICARAALLSSLSADLMVTEVSRNLMFLQPSSMECMVFLATGAHVPFSMKPTVRF